MNNNPFLEVRNLTKRYRSLTAVSDVSFSISRGEILGLIGPNGSGKTTLFECLGGTLPANGGTVVFNGRALDLNQRKSLLFYLPDAITPWPMQSLQWAIEFTLELFGGRRELRDDVVRRLDLEALLNKRMGALSKGQRKRALLAIGLLMPQPLLVADEPFEGLDLRQTREIALALRSFAGENRTMLLSIHQISDAARVCDRFVLLSAGRSCGEGTLAELSNLAGERRGRATFKADLEEVFLALT